jgi:DNA (cytosine-5)-methyltransferase 1
MKLPVISLYSGCGGMDFGFEAAGFHTAVALEMDAACCRTLRKNRNWAVMETDVFAVSTEEILGAAGLKSRQAAVLIGGPPCQPFSKSGYWAKGDSLRLNDPRANTLKAYLNLLEAAQPAAFVMENVSGLAFTGKDEGLNLLLREIEGINARTGCNYRPAWRILKAAEYGVPQLRERLFLVAARDGKAFKFPEAKFAPAALDVGRLIGSDMSVYRTCWDALGDIQSDEDNDDLAPRGKWASLLATIPEGQNYLWHTDRGGGEPLFGWRRRYWNFLLKVSKRLPSWTIQAQPGPSTGPFHWDGRRFSRRELCRIQTFPDNVRITGSYLDAHRQVGNAVPSLLAEVIGRAIRKQYFGCRQQCDIPNLLPPLRENCPRPSVIKSVPKSFLKLRCSETPHPGTGMGHGALARLDAPLLMA